MAAACSSRPPEAVGRLSGTGGAKGTAGSAGVSKGRSLWCSCKINPWDGSPRDLHFFVMTSPAMRKVILYALHNRALDKSRCSGADRRFILPEEMPMSRIVRGHVCAVCIVL